QCLANDGVEIAAKLTPELIGCGGALLSNAAIGGCSRIRSSRRFLLHNRLDQVGWRALLTHRVLSGQQHVKQDSQSINIGRSAHGTTSDLLWRCKLRSQCAAAL